MRKNKLFYLSIAIVFAFLQISQPLLDVNTNKIVEDKILLQSQDAEKSYIDQIYFVGDSTTYHFHKVGINLSHILIPDSLTLKLDSRIDEICVSPYNISIAETLKRDNASICIITIGVNGADSFSEKAYKIYYKKLIDSIKHKSPDTRIILQSVFPVAEWYSNERHGITNHGIDRLNGWIQKIAIEEDLYYLDTQSVLKNESGALIQEYQVGDGVHINEIGYQQIIEYIRTHALIEE